MVFLLGNYTVVQRGVIMHGKMIVIEGLDGSGKATQSQLIFDELKKNGKDVKKVSFPDYKSDSSALIKMYLNGEFGHDPGDVNAYAASSFYAVDRYASYKKDWASFYDNGGIIIADRYTTSNAIHQCSKLQKEKWDEYLEWLFYYEYEQLGIPKPDMVVYLNVDTQVSQKLMTERYSGDETKKDIHEGDLEYLKRSSVAADYCCKKLSWSRIECCSQGVIRSKADILGEIVDLPKFQEMFYKK